MKKQITISELKSLIKEEAMKLNRRTLLEGEKKKLMEELDMIGDYGLDSEKAFSSYLIDKKEISAGENDDPGDLVKKEVWLYKIPKNSNFGFNTEDEMYEMLIDMFGRGENGGPGQKYTRISYDIKESSSGNYWMVKISEKTAYDI